GDLFDAHGVVQQEGAEALDQRVGLAGASAGLHEQGRGGVRLHAETGGLVGEVAHEEVSDSFSVGSTATRPVNAGWDASGSRVDSSVQAWSSSAPPMRFARSRDEPRPPRSGNHPRWRASTRLPTSSRTLSITSTETPREIRSNSPRSVQYQYRTSRTGRSPAVSAAAA